MDSQGAPPQSKDDIQANTEITLSGTLSSTITWTVNPCRACSQCSPNAHRNDPPCSSLRISPRAHMMPLCLSPLGTPGSSLKPPHPFCAAGDGEGMKGQVDMDNAHTHMDTWTWAHSPLGPTPSSPRLYYWTNMSHMKCSHGQPV